MNASSSCPVAGAGEFRIGESIVPFRAGDILVVDNLRLHAIWKFHGANRRAIVVTFEPRLVAGFAALPCDHGFLSIFHAVRRGASPRLPAAAVRASGGHTALVRLIEIEQAMSGGSRGVPQSRIKLLLLELLDALGTLLPPAPPSPALPQVDRLVPLLKWLEQNFSRKISVAEAARIVGLSGARFMRRFRQATGSTFVEYLNQIRLREAYRLLRETPLPVGEIAEQCGFSDQSYFDRRFKAYFGIPPRELRRRAGSDKSRDVFF
jgi:AraC-like DNA-binding protein